MGKATVVRVTRAEPSGEEGIRIASGDAFPYTKVEDTDIKAGDLAVYLEPGTVVPERLVPVLGWMPFEPETFKISSEGALVNLAVVLNIFRPFAVGLNMSEGADVSKVLGIA